MAAAPLQDELLERFGALFGREARVVVRAPGRVNLIGEHTDYNDGLVLPCAIGRSMWAAAAPREDGRVRVHSRELSPGPGAPDAVVTLRPGGPRTGEWTDYVQGAMAVAGERAGEGLPGLDLVLASDLPRESGLSSSAALGVALMTVFDRAAGLGLDAEARARGAHRLETEFVGLSCGIMDPYASALGRRGHALRIDCRSLEVEAIPFPDTLRILVAGSGVRRRLVSGGYGDRRAECEAALRATREVWGDGTPPASLRDVPEERVPELEAALPPIPFRRLRHVISENRRVDAFCAALRAGDPVRAGALLREGQASLRDDFEVSVPELDALCALADAEPGVLGSRLTGAGFGGCTLHLVEAGAAPAVADRLAEGFRARFGRRPPIFEVAPADGAEVLR
jgi:galactokinase